MTIPKRPEKKSRNYICGDTYGNGFNECHDLDTAYFTDLLKEVWEAIKKNERGEVGMMKVIEVVRDLIERIDNP